MRVLVADDAPFIQEIVKAVLEDEGHEIVGFASNGEEAFRYALKLRPDLILMDLIMPGLSGVEATARIKAEWPEAMIVAFSTQDQEHMVMQALEAGCSSFLAKPFQKKDLLDMISKL